MRRQEVYTVYETPLDSIACLILSRGSVLLDSIKWVGYDSCRISTTSLKQGAELTIDQTIPVELSLTTNLSTKSPINHRPKSKSIGR